MPEHYRDAFEPEDPRKRGLGEELGGLDLTDEGSLLSQDFALAGMAPGEAPYNFTQYELNQPRYGLSGRFSRTGTGRTPFDQLQQRESQFAPQAPTQYRINTPAPLREQDAGADSFEFGSGAIGRTGADNGFGYGTDFGTDIDQYGDFGFDFASRGPLGGYLGAAGLGAAVPAGMALNLGASPGAAFGFGLKGLTMAAANPLAMAALFAAGADQAFDRAQFGAEFETGLGARGIDAADVYGADLDISDPGYAGQVGQRAAADIIGTDLGAHRERGGIPSAIAGAFGYGNAHARNMERAHTYGYTPAGEAQRAAQIDAEAEAAAQAKSFAEFEAAQAHGNIDQGAGDIGGPGTRGTIGFDGSLFSDPLTGTVTTRDISLDRSGNASRGMGIHGGVSETEAAMAAQAKAAAAGSNTGALSDAAMSGDFGGGGDGGGNGK
jgi:hypothetical protein